MLNRWVVTKWLISCVLIVGAPFAVSAQEPGASTKPTAENLRALPTESEKWMGDFDGMLKRRQIRIVVPYSRTFYFNDNGRERGIIADSARDFERYINRKYRHRLRNRPITVYLIPTTRDLLLGKVASGFGDIAAGNLTITDERKQWVDFVAPKDQKPVSELVVTGHKSPRVFEVEDLSGKTVHVRKASSYYESLMALNSRLRKAGKPAVNLVLVPDALEDEDMMEMVSAGLIETIVVDDWKAKLWAKLLPKIRVNEKARVRTGGLIGWGFRKRSPKLTAELKGFYNNFMKKHGTLNWRRHHYYKEIKQITNSTGSTDAKRFHHTLRFFEKYGRKYGFDPLMLAAQGYQESRLDQKKRSRAGAIGIMQLMPATGAAMKVGNIKITEPNIHAGAKYMDELLTRYFRDAKFNDSDRSLFAFAAYNAGPGRIASMRKQAAKRGLDPNKWFNHVEVVTARKIGIQTTTYVRNIYKYYVAYKLMIDVAEVQKQARETVEEAG